LIDRRMTSKPDYTLETDFHAQGFGRIVGVDEVGRGPWCGPVTAAAVWLNPAHIPEGLNDSKKLSAHKRDAVLTQIEVHADIGIGHASVAEIDEMNILRASHLAMERAILDLTVAPDVALIDGNMVPKGLIGLKTQTVVKGDSKSVSIAAASIVAKICRDRIMVALAQQHPGYGWETNAGYGTKAHQEGLREFGVTPHHRRSFKPIHNILYQEKT